MARFAFISPQTEPFRLDATNALKSCHVDEGSLEGINIRADAARTVAALETPSESDSTRAVTSNASSDSESNGAEALKADSEVDDATEVNRSSIVSAMNRALVKGRERRNRIQRIRLEASETANKRRRVERI